MRKVLLTTTALVALGGISAASADRHQRFIAFDYTLGTITAQMTLAVTTARWVMTCSFGLNFIFRLKQLQMLV